MELAKCPFESLLASFLCFWPTVLVHFNSVLSRTNRFRGKYDERLCRVQKVREAHRFTRYIVAFF